MKKAIISILTLLCITVNALAQGTKALGWASKVQKSIVSVLAYDKDKNLLHSGTGIYISDKGEAIADYAIMRDAYSAVVVDAAGNKSNVTRILGADDTYALVKFQVDTKKVVAAAKASSAATKGASIFSFLYTKEKNGDFVAAAVNDTTMLWGKYPYYGLASDIDSKYIGAPVFNSNGELLGTMQTPTGGKGYVLGINFIDELTIKAISSRSANISLNNIHIPKGLPDSQEESLVYLYFKSQNTGNDEYIDLVNLFVSTYPQNAEGYFRRATPLIDVLRFDDAESDLQTYLKLASDKGQANANVAQTIYNKLVYQPEPAYDKWTYDAALGYVDKAIGIENKIDYRVMKTQILLSNKQYDEAIAIFDAINNSSERNPGTLYAASIAHERKGDSLSVQIELMDSAIAMMGDSLTIEASNYILRRGKLLSEASRNREAVRDYNTYYELMGGRVSHVFYYDREQLEVKSRMYQQALDDIDKAIAQAPREPLYLLEKAALKLRVNDIDGCIEAANQCIALDPEVGDAYRMLGYAQIQKGDKVNAKKNLEKAISLGDENAKEVMDKYLK